MKKFLGILFLGLFFCNFAYADYAEVYAKIVFPTLPKSELPECDKEIKIKKWTNCHGTEVNKKYGVYVGEFIKGKANGLGKNTYKNGAIYIGEWKNNRSHGKGLETYGDNGETKIKVWCEGEFEKGKRHGQATCYWADGAVYVGGWSKSKMHGQGTFTEPNGVVWEGKFKNDNFPQ